MWKRTAIVVGVLVALTGWARAQPTVVPTSPSGNECWTVGQGPNGPSNFLCINQVRNTTGYQVLSSASGTIVPAVSTNSLMVAAAPAASTIFNTPPNPLADGTVFQVCNVTAAAWTNASTLAASTGQTISGGTITTTTLGAHLCVELIFQLSNTTWYQIR